MAEIVIAARDIPFCFEQCRLEILVFPANKEDLEPAGIRFILKGKILVEFIPTINYAEKYARALFCATQDQMTSFLSETQAKGNLREVFEKAMKIHF